MKYFNSERGYTLIITLLLVVLILLFTATFTVASMNQAKQVNKTDESYVATSVAEMGHEYFINLFNKKNKEIFNEFNTQANLINNDVNKTIQQKDKEIGDLNIQYKQSIIQTLNDYTNQTKEVSEEVNFILASYLTLSDNSFQLEISGNAYSSTKDIFTTITVPLQEYSIESPDSQNPNNSVSNLNNILNMPSFNDLFPSPFPGFLNTTLSCATQGGGKKFSKDQICKTNNSNAINMMNGGTYYYYGNNISEPVNNHNGSSSELYIENQQKNIVDISNINGLKDTNIYINGPAKFQNYKGSGNLDLYVNGDTQLQHINTNKDSSIFINGFLKLQNIDISNQGNTNYKIYAKKAEWDAINGIENSIINIQEDLKGNQVTNFSNNTTLFVGGKAMIFNLKLNNNSKLITQELTVEQISDIKNSKICVSKSINFKNGANIDTNSKIYVLSETQVSTNILNRVTRVSASQFEQYCDVNFTSNTNNDSTLISELDSMPDINVNNISYE